MESEAKKYKMADLVNMPDEEVVNLYDAGAITDVDLLNLNIVSGLKNTIHLREAVKEALNKDLNLQLTDVGLHHIMMETIAYNTTFTEFFRRK